MYSSFFPENYSAFLAEIQAANSRVFSLNLERPHFLKVQFLYLGHPSAKECHMIVMLHKECKLILSEQWILRIASLYFLCFV